MSYQEDAFASQLIESTDNIIAYGPVTNKNWAIVNPIIVTNVTANPVNYSLYVNPSGEGFELAHARAYNCPLAAYDFDSFLYNFVIKEGGIIGIQCDTASAINIYAAGVLMR